MVGSVRKAQVERLPLPAGGEGAPAAPAPLADPLALALAFVTRHYGRAYEPAALAAGVLPAGGRFDLDSLAAAAARVGFAALREPTDLAAVPAFALPLLVPLAAGGCLVWTGRRGDAVEVYEPRPGQATTQRMGLAELQRLAGPEVLFLRPRHDFDLAGEPPAAERGWFWGALGRNWWIYAHAALGALMVNLLALASPLFVMTVYDRVVPNNALETLWVLAAGIALVAVFDFVLRMLRGYLIDAAGRRLDLVLGERLFGRVLRMKLSAGRQSAGALAATLREFDFLRDFLGSACMTVLADLPFVLVFLLVIWLIGGDLALVPALALPFVIAVALAVQWPLGRLTRKALVESQQRQSHVFEVLQGLETLKAIRAEAWAERRWSSVLASSAVSQMKLRFWTNLALNVTQLAQYLVTVGLVVLGVEAIAAGDLSLGGLIACVLLANRVLAPLAQISSVLTRWQQARTALGALDRLMRTPIERAPGERRVHRPFLEGAIEFREVAFTYPGQELRALDNVSLRIGKGERIGLVGRVGSGKTTLIKLIQGLYEPSAGIVRVDDLEVRQIEPADLRRQIGYVAQQTALFRGTIRDNLVMGAPQASDAEVMRAVEMAGLGDLIRQAPRGLDQEVGEQGLQLSGGQRQLVALARALVLDPPILLLDEPTAHLDALAERQFLEAMRSFMPGRTLVLVTHRAALLGLVDRLAVLERGRIAAEGPRDEVLARLGAQRMTTAG